MYDIAMYLKENYHNIPWLITENGMGREYEEQYMDEKGIVQDDYRIEFIGQHLHYLIKANRRRRKLRRLYVMGIH